MKEVMRPSGESVPFSITLTGNVASDELPKITRLLNRISTNLEIRTLVGEEPKISALFYFQMVKDDDRQILKRAYHRLHTIAVVDPDFPLRSITDGDRYFLEGDPEAAREYLLNDDEKNEKFNRPAIGILTRYLDPTYDPNVASIF